MSSMGCATAVFLLFVVSFVGRAIVDFLLFVYVCFGLFDCGFSAFRLVFCGPCAIVVFYSSFRSALDCTTVVFLRFVWSSVGRAIVVLPAVHLLSFFTTTTSQNSTLFHSYQNTW